VFQPVVAHATVVKIHLLCLGILGERRPLST